MRINWSDKISQNNTANPQLIVMKKLKTSAPLLAWKCNLPVFLGGQTDLSTDKPTDAYEGS